MSKDWLLSQEKREKPGYNKWELRDQHERLATESAEEREAKHKLNTTLHITSSDNNPIAMHTPWWARAHPNQALHVTSMLLSEPHINCKSVCELYILYVHVYYIIFATLVTHVHLLIDMHSSHVVWPLTLLPTLWVIEPPENQRELMLQRRQDTYLHSYAPYISLCIWPTALPSLQPFLWLLLYALIPLFFWAFIACVCYLQYSFLNSLFTKQQLRNYGYKACVHARACPWHEQTCQLTCIPQRHTLYAFLPHLTLTRMAVPVSCIHSIICRRGCPK